MIQAAMIAAMELLMAAHPSPSDATTDTALKTKQAST
jgi:hypothetical protein